MSYQDPSDPRTRRYETGYDANSRAYRQQPPASGYYNDPGYPGSDPGYGSADPRYRSADPGYHNVGSGGPQPADPAYAAPKKRQIGPDINPGMFAGGVVMTGVVTAIAAWLVAWIIRTIVMRINESGKLGIWNPIAQDEFWFALVGFLCALAAGALWYVLQLITPSPDQFYRWIVGLLIVAAVVVPLLLSAEFSVGIATAILHLVIGLPLLTLVPAMGHKSRR